MKEGVLIGDDPECQIIEHKLDLVTSHALLAKDQSLDAIKYAEDIPVEQKKKDSKNLAYYAINHIYSMTTKKVKEWQEGM